MSYILDALKKSDRERKRGDVPNLQTVHIPITVETQTPKLLYGFIFVLLLVLALVVGMMIAGGQTDDFIVKTELSLQKSNTNSLERIDAPLVIEQKVTQTIAPIEKTAVEPLIIKEIAKHQRNKSSVKASEGAKFQGVSEKEQEKKVEKKSRKLNLSDIPYLHEMPDYVQQSIPQMSFAGHVYSTNRQSRSVIINGAAMSEGDALVEGINVVEITVSGVVFSLQGELFRIDILQDWSFE